MNINTMEEYSQLVQLVANAAGISKEAAEKATYAALAGSDSKLIWDASERRAFKDWLRSGFEVESWLLSNPNKIVQVTLAFPKLMSAHKARQANIESAKGEPDAT